VMDARDVDAIARRVVTLLRDAEPGFPRTGLVDADDVALLLCVDRSWVYDHKTELGAVRLGDGRGALRFEAATVHAYVRRHRVGRDDGRAPRVRPDSRRLRVVGGVELLPLPGVGARR
jgi:hypothetical protein